MPTHRTGYSAGGFYKEPNPCSAKLTERIVDTTFENGLVLYTGTEFVDGGNGFTVMIGLPFVNEENKIDEILKIL